MIAVHVAVNGDKFNCQLCRFNRHCDEDSQWPGSRGPASYPAFAIHGIIESRTCLLPMIRPLSRQLLMLYGHYKNGLLPFAGGALEQPDVFLRGMEIIEATLTKLQQDKAHGH